MKVNRLISSISLYIFLTSCQSPSEQIKKAFITVDNSLVTSNSMAMHSIDSLYSFLSQNRQKNIELASKADAVYYAYQDAFTLIDSLKQVLQQKDVSGTNAFLAEKLLVGTAVGDSLTSKISKVYAYSRSGVFDHKKKLSLDSSMHFIKSIRTDKEWTKSYFKSTLTVAAITMLSHFQNECLNGAIITIEDLKYRLLN
jgi:hypothetical protein